MTVTVRANLSNKAKDTLEKQKSAFNRVLVEEKNLVLTSPNTDNQNNLNYEKSKEKISLNILQEGDDFEKEIERINNIVEDV